MVLPANSAAVQILWQVGVPQASKDQALPAGAGLLAAANGLDVASISGAQSRAKARISQALFDNPVDVQQQKVALMRRLGEELGVSMDDYEEPREYAAAIRHAIAEIKAKSADNGAMFIADLEKKLGLDKLGVSLDDLINAIASPDGESGRKLHGALDAQAGGGKAANSHIKPDEHGLYGP